MTTKLLVCGLISIILVGFSNKAYTEIPGPYSFLVGGTAASPAVALRQKEQHRFLVNLSSKQRDSTGIVIQRNDDPPKFFFFPAINLLLRSRVLATPHFTATADMRSYHTAFSSVAAAINTYVGGAGLFHVSPGDIDGSIAQNRAVLDSSFGTDTIWIPGIGNHEAETGEDMEWLRTEYDTGHGLRTPLKIFSNDDGPPGSVKTCYTWDNAETNTHYIMLNQYWNGNPGEGEGSSMSGDDTATDGDVVAPLLTWLEADLIKNQDKAIFVFGHEPAFPENRHTSDSLNKYEANRDAFWALLEEYGVEAYICGHTHTFSRHRGDKNGMGTVWQIDLGNSGNDAGDDGYTFLNVLLLDGRVLYQVFRSAGGWHLEQSWSETANTVTTQNPH